MRLEGKAVGVESQDTFERHGERHAFLQLKTALARHTSRRSRYWPPALSCFGTTYTTDVVVAWTREYGRDLHFGP